MDYQFYKRELFPSWQWDRDQRIERSSEKPLAFTKESIPKNGVISEHAREEIPREDLSYKYALAAGLSCGLFLMLLLGAFFLAKRRKNKNGEEDNRQLSSILVYPSSQSGRAPQILTKDIHFSLPPLRSTSLGDLESQDHPYDSDDVETDSLLVPTQSGHRSYSFSCYGLGVIEPALYRSAGEGGLDLRDDWAENGECVRPARLWYSLRYEPHTEKLLVSLLKARDLPSRAMGALNGCDPFVRLHLMPDERRFLQSKQKKKTCNPYFDETLVFQVSAKDMADHTLKLTIIDGGRPKRRNEIGHVTYPLKDLEIGDGSEQQLFSVELEKEPQEIKSDLGELLVSLVYNENIGRLTATVIEAKRLKFQGDGTSREAYARVALLQNCRAVKEKRTRVARPDIESSLHFAEAFNFRCAPAHLADTSLAFHVFQATPGYDKLIGKVVLGSYMFVRGKALTQWNTAIANPMEHCQQWHPLTE